MADDFDPYRKWLGVTEGERPPTHYQLLGVSPTEEDPEVINGAVIRQSAYVRNFQAGKYSDHATRVLNELAAAKICLLDPAKRAQYDAELKRRRSAASPQPAMPQAAAPQPAAPQRPAATRPTIQPAAPAPRPPAAARGSRPAPNAPASPLDELLGPLAPAARPLASRPLAPRAKSNGNMNLALVVGGIALVGIAIGVIASNSGDPTTGGLAAAPAAGTPEPTPPAAQPFVPKLAPGGGNSASTPAAQSSAPPAHSSSPGSTFTPGATASPSPNANAGVQYPTDSDFDDPFGDSDDEADSSDPPSRSKNESSDDDGSPFRPVEGPREETAGLSKSTVKLPDLKFDKESLLSVGETSERSSGAAFVEQAPKSGWLVGWPEGHDRRQFFQRHSVRGAHFSGRRQLQNRASLRRIRSRPGQPPGG